MILKYLLGITYLFITLLLFGSVANAENIRYKFSGTITTVKNVDFSVDDPFSGSVSVGTKFSGFYEFNPLHAVSPGCNDAATQCSWEFLIPPFHFEVTVGTKTIKTPEDYMVIIYDDPSQINQDTYAVSSADHFDIGANWIASVQISLQDYTATAISDATDIYYVPDLSKFELRQFGIVRSKDGCSGCEGMIFGNIESLTQVLVQFPVVIDIKPNSETNSINVSSAGVIPVAILGAVDFDATTVVPASVSLAGASVKLVGKSEKYLCHQEDVNLDGYVDLVCQIYTAQFFVEEGETTAILEAETTDGTKLRGEDIIRIVPDN